MNTVFVNLKRFDIPRELGGVCPESDPSSWIGKVLSELVAIPLGENLSVVLFTPESLLASSLKFIEGSKARGWAVGCQSVHREDAAPGGNFGAFTSLRTAKSMSALGCRWALVGHSEERKEKLGVLAAYESELVSDPQRMARARGAVSRLIGKEVEAALAAGMKVLLCVGETAEERGDSADQKTMEARVSGVLRDQLAAALGGVDSEDLGRVTVAYEPVWAIGPGKTPPGPDYIGFAARTLRDIAKKEFSIDLSVAYGGGLKEANVAAISAVPGVNGGLVALTRFEGQIGFYPEDFKKILENSAWYPR